MTDIPRGAVGRTARLAALPLGFAGRAALGLGKRVTGMASDVISAEVQQRTAEHLFKVLGQLKGGAMKMGQALSVFEAALPEEIAGPYRAALTKLQEAAPPLPAASVHKVLRRAARPAAGGSGSGARRHAGRGGEHRPGAPGGLARRPRGRGQGPVPGRRRGAARRPQPARPAGRPVPGRSSPGLDVKPLVAELRARITEELDYELEAAAQKAFAKAYADDAEICVPRGRRRRAAGAGHRVDRRHAAVQGHRLGHDRRSATWPDCAWPRCTSPRPSRAGLLHADPHPGNFRLLDDGRLGVLDFGAVARLPGGHPEPIGRLTRLAIAGEAEEVLAGLRDEGFVRARRRRRRPGGARLRRARCWNRSSADEFQFTRAWLRGEAARLANPRGPAYQLGRNLNLPPAYMLIHRVTLGSIGVLCQLEARAPYRSVVERWLPGFAEPAPVA